MLLLQRRCGSRGRKLSPSRVEQPDNLILVL